jgi:hypothetical protein
MIRKVILTAVLILGVAVAGGSPRRAVRAADEKDRAHDSKSAPFVHVVIFRLTNDAPANEVDALIADAHELLHTIPTVRDLKAGRPVPTASPGLTKKDYQVGLMVLFDDAEGMQTYLKHPKHIEYLKRHQKYLNMQKLGVYDFINEKN